MTPHQLKELELEVAGVDLAQCTAEQIEQLKQQLQVLALQKLTPDQVEQVQSHTQCFALMKLNAGQIQQLQAETNNAVLAKLTPNQLQEVKMEAQIHQEGFQRQDQNVNIQQQMQPNIANVPIVPPTPVPCSTVTITRADGTRVEYLVNEGHGNEVSTMCQKVDLFHQGQQNAPLIVPPTVNQPFPPHTL